MRPGRANHDSKSNTRHYVGTSAVAECVTLDGNEILPKGQDRRGPESVQIHGGHPCIFPEGERMISKGMAL